MRDAALWLSRSSQVAGVLWLAAWLGMSLLVCASAPSGGHRHCSVMTPWSMNTTDAALMFWLPLGLIVVLALGSLFCRNRADAESS